MDWTLTMKGGAFAGTYDVNIDFDPPPVLIAWRCVEEGAGCEGHFTSNANFAAINLKTCEAYARTEIRMRPKRIATYELGDLSDGDVLEGEERRELVAGGMGTGKGSMVWQLLAGGPAYGDGLWP